MHDVVIVGGSLAGAAAALHLARASRDVVVVERNREHRRKACGEGLFPLGVAELQQLGLIDELRGQSAPISGVRFSAGEHSAWAPLRGMCGGLGVQRPGLDRALLAHAKAAGADVRMGVPGRGLVVEAGRAAGVKTDGGVIQAKVVVGADGLHSGVRRELRLEQRHRGNRYGVSMHVALSREPEPTIDVYFEDGYELYLTPVGGRMLNAALLLRRQGMRRFAGNLAGAYEQLLRAHPALKSGFEVVDQPSVAGPFERGCRRAWRANVVLAGDAAGFVDGISGEGMSAALVSARVCAEAVNAHLEHGGYAAFRAYDARRRAIVRNSNLVARLALVLSAKPAVARVAVRNLARRPGTFARLTAINTGEAGLRSLRPGDLSALAMGL